MLLIVGGIVFALVVVGFIGIALLIGSSGKVDVAQNSVLVLNVTGDLPDYAPEEPMARIFGIEQKQSFTHNIEERPLQ